MTTQFVEGDDKQQRRELLGYLGDNIAEVLNVFRDKKVTIKIMFDAEES